jgi:hypothetical protein
VTVVNKQEYLPSVPRIALVGIPEIKAKLIEHLVPSLENQIADVIQPLKQDIVHLEDKITETDMRTDDLEQYGKVHSISVYVFFEAVINKPYSYRPISVGFFLTYTMRTIDIAHVYFNI